MLYGLLMSVYIFLSVLLALLILIQKGKGNMGLGNIGGGTQMLFGGSGGQDIFRKITWVLGAIFMAGSLMLAIMKTKESKQFKYALYKNQQQATSQAVEETQEEA